VGLLEVVTSLAPRIAAGFESLTLHMKMQTFLKYKPQFATWDKEPMRTILFKMCKVVGANYYKINFSAERWFMKHTWTKEQEKDFQIWMADRIYKLPDWRKSFQLTKKRKKEAMKVAEDFTWNHGWKTYFG